MKVLGLVLALAGGVLVYCSITGKNIKELFNRGE
jgi:hypothetical protein